MPGDDYCGNKEHGLQIRAHTQTYATDFAVRVDTVNRNSALPKIFQGKFRNRIDRVGLCRTYRSRLASHNGDFALSEVSIHASRVGGDGSDRATVKQAGAFQSTPPGWEATAEQRPKDFVRLFQSTPPGWEATCYSEPTFEYVTGFQSTPPGWEATLKS